MTAKFRKIRIEQDETHLIRFRVWLGETEITNYLSSVTVGFASNRLPEVTLIVAPSRIELPDELSAIIERGIR